MTVQNTNIVPSVVAKIDFQEKMTGKKIGTSAIIYEIKFRGLVGPTHPISQLYFVRF